VGLAVIDNSSSQQTAKFLCGLLLICNKTFVSRRRQVGFKANLLLSICQLYGNPRSVICRVDLNDALLGKLVEIGETYEADQDLEATFGGLVHQKRLFSMQLTHLVQFHQEMHEVNHSGHT
jgi:hypothetical protein